MRNLNFNGESGSEPYTPTAQTSGGPASEGFHSPDFRGDFGAGLLDLHAMDDTELLSEVWLFTSILMFCGHLSWKVLHEFVFIKLITETHLIYFLPNVYS